MGYDNIIFLDPVNEHLTCAICFGPFDEATVCCTNGHVFCKGCLRAAHDQTRCPTCRVKRSAVPTPNRPINDMVESLKVRCCEGGEDAPAAKKPKTDEESGKAHATGCQWEGTLTMWKTEHKRICPLVYVSCPLKCSRRKILRKDVGQHLTICTNREVECDLCCKMIKHSSFDHHKERDCPNTIKDCGLCGEKMTREELGKKGYRPKQNFDDIPCDDHKKCTGHYALCPKIILNCEVRGCNATFAREDAAKHHAENTQYHAALVDKTIEKLYSWFEWDMVELMYVTKKAQLRGTRHKTLESGIDSTLSSYELYLKLYLKGANDPVKAAICSRGSNARSIYSSQDVKLKEITLTVSDTWIGMMRTNFGEIELCEEKSLKTQGGGAFEFSTTLKNRSYDDETDRTIESTLTRSQLISLVDQDVFAVRAHFCVEKTKSALLYDAM